MSGYVEMNGVNYGHVNNAGELLTDAYYAISMILTETEAAIAPLQGTWSGPSEQEYEGVQARWTSDLQQLKSSLGQCIGTLGQLAIDSGQDITFPLPDGAGTSG
jgi:uncharacterized protein YukE